MEKSRGGAKERIVWIDILRGIMMFAVVVGHSLTPGELKKYIFSFHMPAFFIISGMTFFFNKEFDAKRYLIKKVKGLLVPYLLLNLYVTPLFYVNVKLGSNGYKSPLELVLGVLYSNVDTHYTMPSNTTWFITCLFLTDMLFFAFRKLFKSDGAMTVAIVATTSIFYELGFVAEKGGGIWHWQVAFTAVIFYAVGYFFMKNLNAVKAAVTGSKLKGVLTSLLFLVTGCLLSRQNSKVSKVKDKYGNGLYFYLSAIFTTFAVVFLLIMLSENRWFLTLAKPINFIGKTTLPYIALHVPVIKILKKTVPIFGDKDNRYLLLMGIIVYIGLMPFAWFFDKLLPFKKKKAGAVTLVNKT